MFTVLFWTLPCTGHQPHFSSCLSHLCVYIQLGFLPPLALGISSSQLLAPAVLQVDLVIPPCLCSSSTLCRPPLILSHL
jgi:hypothetical protein